MLNVLIRLGLPFLLHPDVGPKRRVSKNVVPATPVGAPPLSCESSRVDVRETVESAMSSGPIDGVAGPRSARKDKGELILFLMFLQRCMVNCRRSGGCFRVVSAARGGTLWPMSAPPLQEPYYGGLSQ